MSDLTLTQRYEKRIAELEAKLAERDQRVQHLQECIREVAYPLAIGANHARERYPLMYAECEAMLSKLEERDREQSTNG